MKDNSQLEIDERDGLLRITIPFGAREKIWMTITVTVMLLFGTMMSLVAEFAARSATNVRVFWAIPFIMLGVIGGFYLLSLLTIRAMPGSVIEFDGATLSLGSIGSKRRSSWPREKIKSLRVSRLPMVPIANLIILLDGEPSVRTGVCRKRDLEVAAAKLTDALALRTRDRK